MICPACRHHTIVVEHKNIELDYCPNCRGVWFDAGELELLLEATGLESPQPFLDAALNSAEAKTTEKKRKCPICRRKMKKVYIDPEGRIMVDVCYSGHGIWFAGGEVDGLIKSLAGKAPGKAGPHQDVADFIGTVFKAPT
jgi:Zn-finger nucleic acid-binding protein